MAYQDSLRCINIPISRAIQYMSLVCSLLIYQSVWRQSQTAILNRMRVRIYKEREREGTGRSIGYIWHAKCTVEVDSINCVLIETRL